MVPLDQDSQHDTYEHPALLMFLSTNRILATHGVDFGMGEFQNGKH